MNHRAGYTSTSGRRPRQGSAELTSPWNEGSWSFRPEHLSVATPPARTRYSDLVPDQEIYRERFAVGGGFPYRLLTMVCLVLSVFFFITIVFLLIR